MWEKNVMRVLYEIGKICDCWRDKLSGRDYEKSLKKYMQETGLDRQTAESYGEWVYGR